MAILKAKRKARIFSDLENESDSCSPSADASSSHEADPLVLRPIEHVISNTISAPCVALSPRCTKRSKVLAGASVAPFESSTQAPESTTNPSLVFSRVREVLRQPAITTEVKPLTREAQYQQLQSIVSSFIGTGRGTSAYVSGLPGTGKSHTMSKVMQSLTVQSGCPSVSTVCINCMSVSSAGDVYKQILSGISSRHQANLSASTTVTFEDLACALSRHTKSKANGKAQGTRLVVVLDEMDNLVAKSQQEVYNLFMLPHLPGAQVLLVGIANSIDLTDRALPALTLRGCTPTLVCFPAYTTSQLSTILKATLERLPNK